MRGRTVDERGPDAAQLRGRAADQQLSCTVGGTEKYVCVCRVLDLRVSVRDVTSFYCTLHYKTYSWRDVVEDAVPGRIIGS